MKLPHRLIVGLGSAVLIMVSGPVGADEARPAGRSGPRVVWVRPERVPAGQRATLTRLLLAATDGGLNGFVTRDSHPKAQPAPDFNLPPGTTRYCTNHRSR